MRRLLHRLVAARKKRRPTVAKRRGASGERVPIGASYRGASSVETPQIAPALAPGRARRAAEIERAREVEAVVLSRAAGQRADGVHLAEDGVQERERVAVGEH